MNKKNLLSFFAKFTSRVAAYGMRDAQVARWLHSNAYAECPATHKAFGIQNKLLCDVRNYATKKKVVEESPDHFGKYSGAENLVFLNCDVDKKSKKYKRLFVMFYAPWCRHSIVLKPEFAKAAALTDAEECQLGVVDCNYHQKVIDKFQIDGFPTLLLFENGELKEEYDGPRKAKDILNYIENKIGSEAKSD